MVKDIELSTNSWQSGQRFTTLSITAKDIKLTTNSWQSSQKFRIETKQYAEQPKIQD
jgi:hypothetical protein